ncbi:MAG: hypothetical protein P1R74_15965 [Sedimenticola sp.]|nr:hypothetical protein [Sedimenticola sp.]
MWRLTLFSNVLILFFFWLLAMTAITPAHNLLIQYSDTIQALPILTDVAIVFRSLSILIPLTWAIGTLFWGRKMARLIETKRCESLTAHTSISLCMGLALFFIYLLAGILPLLKIGATLD